MAYFLSTDAGGGAAAPTGAGAAVGAPAVAGSATSAGATIGMIFFGGTGSVGVRAVSTACRSSPRLAPTSRHAASNRQLCAAGAAALSRQRARTSLAMNCQLAATVFAADVSACAHWPGTLSRAQTAAACHCGSVGPACGIDCGWAAIGQPIACTRTASVVPAIWRTPSPPLWSLPIRAMRGVGMMVSPGLRCLLRGVGWPTRSCLAPRLG